MEIFVDTFDEKNEYQSFTAVRGSVVITSVSAGQIQGYLEAMAENDRVEDAYISVSGAFSAGKDPHS